MIKFRIDWSFHENLVIRDVHWKSYERVVKFMKENYFLKNRIFEQAGFFNFENTVEHYEQYLMHCLRNECSVMAVEVENEEEIKAVAILTWNTEEHRSWRATTELLPDGKISQFLRLHYNALLQCMQKEPKRDNLLNSLHMFEFYVEPEIQTAEFMEKFFDAIEQTARHMHMPCITFLAMSEAERQIVNETKFELIDTIIYSLYQDKSETPFFRLRDIEEMTATLHFMPVTSLLRYRSVGEFNTSRPRLQSVSKRLHSLTSLKYNKSFSRSQN